MPVLPASQSPSPKSVTSEETDGVWMTPDEYIVFERASDEKHDYINGKVVLRVAGTSPAHNRIATDFARAAGNLLETVNTSHEVWSSDIKVFVNDKMRFYPDAMISGENAQFDNKDTLYNPLVIVEVPSRSTRNFDKNGKFVHYQGIASLQHYVLIEQDRVEVIHHEKQADGSWKVAGTFTDLADDLPLQLGDVQIIVPLSRIYRRVSF